MAAGQTTTASLADSLETVIDAARIVREYEGVMPRLVDRQRLAEGTGLDWDEISLAQLTAQTITENTELNNPQSLSDSLFSIRPAMIGVQTLLTKRVQLRITPKTYAKIGSLKQNAMQRLKDQQGLAVYSGATQSYAGSGTTLTSGHIAAARAVVRNGNGNEPSMGDIFVVLHSYQWKDIRDELVAGVGTYTVPQGLTAETFRKGFEGTIDGANGYTDDHIAITSNNATGGMHAREGIVLVEGFSPRTFHRDRPEIGGGADEIFMYDEFAFGERSAGNWVAKITSDATTPTS